MFKLCDTCENIKINQNNYNITSRNEEKWIYFPFPLPVLNRQSGTQTTQIDFGPDKRNRLVYFWGSYDKESNFPVKFPSPYADSDNNGLVFLDDFGKATIKHNCPQLYKEEGQSYIPHLHFLISNKKNSRWEDRIYTQGILCSVLKHTVQEAIFNKTHLIIDALPTEYFNKLSIPTAKNIPVGDAEKMSEEQLFTVVDKMIKSDNKLKKFMKKNKLNSFEFPIIVYCYDSKCNASHKLANELFRAGFVNIMRYNGGIMDYTSREIERNTRKHSNKNLKKNSKRYFKNQSRKSLYKKLSNKRVSNKKVSNKKVSNKKVSNKKLSNKKVSNKKLFNKKVSKNKVSNKNKK